MTLKLIIPVIKQALFFSMFFLPSLPIAYALPDDASCPIEITSDTAEFDDKAGLAKHFGHVLMDQGSRHLEAETLIIERNAAHKIEKMTAMGKPARFKTRIDIDKPLLDAVAETLIFYPERQTIYLRQNAEVMQDNHRVKGSRLVYFLDTKRLISEFTPQKRTTVIIPPRAMGDLLTDNIDANEHNEHDTKKIQ